MANCWPIFCALHSNGAILVYDITDEDSFFKVSHVKVYLVPTIEVIIIYTCNPVVKSRSFFSCTTNSTILSKASIAQMVTYLEENWRLQLIFYLTIWKKEITKSLEDSKKTEICFGHKIKEDRRNCGHMFQNLTATFWTLFSQLIYKRNANYHVKMSLHTCSFPWFDYFWHSFTWGNWKKKSWKWLLEMTFCQLPSILAENYIFLPVK